MKRYYSKILCSSFFLLFAFFIFFSFFFFSIFKESNANVDCFPRNIFLQTIISFLNLLSIHQLMISVYGINVFIYGNKCDCIIYILDDNSKRVYILTNTFLIYIRISVCRCCTNLSSC